jgi:hypothetical protein
MRHTAIKINCHLIIYVELDNNVPKNKNDISRNTYKKRPELPAD